MGCERKDVLVAGVALNRVLRSQRVGLTQVLLRLRDALTHYGSLPPTFGKGAYPWRACCFTR